MRKMCVCDCISVVLTGIVPVITGLSLSERGSVGTELCLEIAKCIVCLTCTDGCMLLTHV